MEIRASCRYIDLKIDKTAQPVTNRGNTSCKHGGVRDHHNVSLEKITVAINERVQIGTADFFFTFNQILDVDRQLFARTPM